jgi:hypothetical protein
VGNLLQKKTNRRHTLDSRILIGRSRKCDLRLVHPSISGEHAVIWWSGEGWRLRELSSRNGTRLDGEAVSPEKPVALLPGVTIAFGLHPLAWQVESVSPPLPRAVPLDGRSSVSTTDGLLALPEPEAPTALIYPDPSAGWLLEEGDTIRPVQNLDIIQLSGESWRLHLPQTHMPTVDGRDLNVGLSALELEFTVSSDEEHVSVVVISGEQRIDLGSRAHHYALLTLARLRLEDDDPSPLARGWIYQEDLARMLQVSRSQLNLFIFRARKQLAVAGVLDARGLIERRLDSRQLRIGAAALTIKTA